MTGLCRALCVGVLAAAPLAAWAGNDDPANGHNYVGAERCRRCHEAQYEIWKRGPHASAHLPLTDAQRGDAKCHNCHVSLPGESDPSLAGVQCERCHGPGRYYHHPYVMRDHELARAVGLVIPQATHCQQCHTETAPSIEPFDFTIMWARISHNAEALRKAAESDEMTDSSATAAASATPAGRR